MQFQAILSKKCSKGEHFFIGVLHKKESAFTDSFVFILYSFTSYPLPYEEILHRSSCSPHIVGQVAC